MYKQLKESQKVEVKKLVLQFKSWSDNNYLVFNMNKSISVFTCIFLPSNSRFLTYGNFPLEDHLKFINENYLKHFSKIEPGTAVPVESRWSNPVSNVFS